MKKFEEMFQFLIGSLRTPLTMSRHNTGKPFQFLIGSLRTNKYSSITLSRKNSFQFLIGSLRTSSDDR